MNIYEEMIEKLQTKEKLNSNDEQILSKLKKESNIVKATEKYGVDFLHRRFIGINYTQDGIPYGLVDLSPSSTYIGKHEEITNIGMFETPENLLSIRFSTGAYIFGEDYPTAFFREFYNEFLETMQPKYRDNINNRTFYELDRIKEVLEKFDVIINKYENLNRENRKQRAIEEKLREIEKLKASLNS
ncbi:hypothetical protein [Konateibacter massiliensis]|uniref:hypothetical protein n=1 Tax=Konateibacter massiliensis TaxID=2002841 RepID=UPI000C162750|nr:hypothetical protein [Konateibacter massiliensis]